MRILLTATAALMVTVSSVACGSDTKASPTRAATPAASAAVSATSAPSAAPRTQTAATPAGSATIAPAATPPVAGEIVEVTGIVGGVILSGNSATSDTVHIIEIKRLQGAAVTQVAVDARTIIRKAGGGTLRVNDIRTSDRIIARGALNDRRDSLLASEITVQDVVPGAQPGG